MSYKHVDSNPASFHGNAKSQSDPGEEPTEALLELRAIFRNTAVAIVFTRGSWIRRCNECAAEIFGYPAADELAGQHASVIFKGSDDYQRLLAKANPLLISGSAFHADWDFIRADGVELICNLYGQAIDSADMDKGAVWVIEDVTEKRRTEKALRERQSVIDATLEYMDQGISIVDADLRCLATNRRFRELLGIPESMLRAGTYFAEIIRYNAERGEYGPGDVDEQVQARVALAKRFEPHDLERTRPDGTVIEIRGRPIPGGGFVTVYTDVTKRAQTEEHIRYLATHDGLTGLPNRERFSQVLTEAVASARNGHRSFGLLFIDLDRFKIINDSLGHEAGDSLLKEMASRFRECVGEQDMIARLGGDEFVVLAGDASNREDLALLAQRFIAAALDPVTVMGRECRVSASIGVCMFPDDADDEQTLMKHADLAMYRAKERGKCVYAFYSSALGTNTFDRMAMEADLRHALDREELFVVYQPKVDIRTGTITGVEALLRWRHPRHGLVPPTKFIAVAEESGLILSIGRWVLRTACAQAMEWSRLRLGPVSMAVNLSPRQFRDEHLLSDLDAIVAETGMDPGLMELEITESVIMVNIRHAVETLQAIKDRGVALAIDDFGTGFSSLSHIKHFPIDTLKVDRSFIRDLGVDSQDRAITSAIISMSKTLGLAVVGEGVETEEQSNFLREQGCDQMQGYLFSRPLTATDLAKLLRQRENGVISYC